MAGGFGDGSRMAKVCLNMIVKNEAAIIERCLKSVASHIDCYTICDTGSTDGTDSIISRLFLERGVAGAVLNTTFRNFGQARNEALDAARRSSLEFDYVLLCDADMELVVHRPSYRDELTSDFYLVSQKSVSLAYENIRLVKRDASCRYKGFTHEYLDTFDRSPVSFDGISFIDHASGSNRVGKLQRDVDLLLKALEAEPNDARSVFYLANSYFDMGRFDQAIAAYSRRETMGGWEEEVFYSGYRSGLALGHLGRRAEMIDRLLKTFGRYPHRAEPLHALALDFQRTGEHRLAYEFARMGLDISPSRSALFVEPDVYSWRLKDIISVSLHYMGRHEESVRLCDALLELVPERERPRVLKNREWSERAIREASSRAG